MKSFFRNLKSFKAAYFLNIAGLSVAFAAFIMIMIQVRHEFSFDRKTQDHDRIFRAEMILKDNLGAMGDAGQDLPIFSRGISERVIHSSSLVESGAVIFPYLDLTYITVENTDGIKGFKVDFDPCSPDIYKTFHFNMKEGFAQSIEKPDNVLIPRSLSETLFGGESAIGKVITVHEYLYQVNNRVFTVGGVYEDFQNSQLKNVIYVPLTDDDINNQGQFNYYLYVKLSSKDDAEDVIKSFAENDLNKQSFSADLYLRPLKDIYFCNDCLYDDRSEHGSLSTTLILLSIGILIILLAAINFTNFSMALVPFRIRNINTKKVLGSTNRALENGLMADAAWTSFFSALIATAIVYFISRSGLRDIASCSIGIIDNIDIVLGTVVLSVIIGIIAGIYPAKYCTSFSPALVLKGNFGLSPKGIALRKVLVAFQFVISLSLIAGSLLIQKQNRYMQGGDLKFDKDNLYISEMQSSLDSAKIMSMESRINDLSYVEDVAFAQDKICSKDNFQRWSFKSNGEHHPVTVMVVSWNFLKTVGIELKEGSYPTREMWKQPKMIICPNKAAAEAYDLKYDTPMDMGSGETTMQCITENAMIYSMKKNPDPAILVSYGWGSVGNSHYIYVRTIPGADSKTVISDINRIIQDYDPVYPISLQPFTSVIEQRFSSDRSFEKAIKGFSILSIIISMIGIFGLILFDTQQRRKEIALRRIHGAGEKEVLMMFSRPYIILLSISFIISIPIVIYFGHIWLSNFALRVSITPWIFIISLLVIFLITFTTIFIQVMRTVRNNPVDSIKIA